MKRGVSKSDGGTVCLAILLTEVITWFKVKVADKRGRDKATERNICFLVTIGKAAVHSDESSQSSSCVVSSGTEL
ncbi:hypothetical protein SKAU_G00056400 [Synaphobranchus kaupii]|uniref:Uncharacterized protein n=1 Tax=Synaphobranchus kaupii TaxID=118154 RepID=A0A9Q1JAA5_SYNKA|nr:hypothetical protein SKAU_G00056400 [Synaphobranchus kaupii]